MGLILSGLKYFFKGIGYVFYFIMPVLFCAIGVGGAMVLFALTGPTRDDLVQPYIDEQTHIVTIWWDAEGVSQSEIKVREDVNWTIKGVSAGYKTPFYYETFMGSNDFSQDKSIKQHEEYPYEFDLPKEATKEGWKFLGLFNTPFGGTQFVNGAGYSLRDVTTDMVLYAVWQEV